MSPDTRVTMPDLTRLRTFVGRYTHTVPRVAYALTFGLRSRPNRTLLWQLAGQLGFEECKPTLPMIDARDLVDERLPVVLREAEGTDGNVSARELIILSQLVRTRAPRRIFEIGTFDGRTTLALAANAPDDAVVFTLDLPPNTSTAMDIRADERAFVEKPASGARVHGTDVGRKVHQLYGDSAAFDFSGYPSTFIFVDGSHARDYVIADSRNALAMLGNDAGDIVWHDYTTWSGVTEALNTLQREPAFAGIRHIRGTTLAVLSRSSR